MTTLMLTSDKISISIRAQNEDVSHSFNIEKKDNSGDSSFSDVGDGGIKPWEIQYAGLIPFGDETMLRDICAAARTTQEDGSAVVFDIVEEISNALGIRRVIFAGQVRVKKAQNLQAYAVSFGLIEHQGSAERAEARRVAEVIEIQTSDGTIKTDGTPSDIADKLGKVLP